MILFRITLLLLGSCLFLFSQNNFKETDRSPRNANYDISVQLLPDSMQLEAEEVLIWRNITSNPVNDLQFHLYLNAFSHMKTTFMLESGGQLRGDKFSRKKTGWTRIKKISMDGESLLDSLSFIRPDDGNIYDSTVVRIGLRKTVNPGESIQVRIKFHAKLPRVFARTGYANVKDRDLRFFMVGQWFPKIGVLEEKGWNCHQFHGNTEFFSDYGVYNVKITVPDEYVVGASGELVESVKQDTLRTDHYLAEDVHDFSWTAYPDFLELKDTLDQTEIRLLYNPEEEEYVKEQMGYLKKGMAILNNKIGVYPYSTLTVVNPPKGANGAQGMEYPTLICAGITPGLPAESPWKFSMVTIHEYGHEYFYGLLGSNEFEYAWLDEGFTTFVEMYILDSLYQSGIPSFLPDLPPGMMHRIGYKQSPDHYSLMKKSYYQGEVYGINSYSRPGTLLETLRLYLGDKEFFGMLSQYFRQWHFHHPYPEDFFKVLQENTKKDISWFVEDYFKSDKTVDYEVLRVKSKKIKDKKNYVPLPNVIVVDQYDPSDSAATYYQSRISLINKKDGRFPIELLVTFEDSSTLDISRYYDGINGTKYQEHYFLTDKKIKKVEVDPRRVNLIDLDLTNNSWVLKSESSPTPKYTDFFKHLTATLIQLLAGL
jgi:hypothetical protein